MGFRLVGSWTSSLLDMSQKDIKIAKLRKMPNLEAA